MKKSSIAQDQAPNPNQELPTYEQSTNNDLPSYSENYNATALQNNTKNPYKELSEITGASCLIIGGGALMMCGLTNSNSLFYSAIAVIVVGLVILCGASLSNSNSNPERNPPPVFNNSHSPTINN